MSEPGHRPKPTAEDLDRQLHRLHDLLQSAMAALGELRSQLAALNLRSVERSYDEKLAVKFVENTGWQMTDSSLSAELHERGASKDEIDRLLMIAHDRRRLVRLGEEAQEGSASRIEEEGGSPETGT